MVLIKENIYNTDRLIFVKFLITPTFSKKLCLPKFWVPFVVAILHKSVQIW